MPDLTSFLDGFQSISNSCVRLPCHQLIQQLPVNWKIGLDLYLPPNLPFWLYLQILYIYITPYYIFWGYTTKALLIGLLTFTAIHSVRQLNLVYRHHSLWHNSPRIIGHYMYTPGCYVFRFFWGLNYIELLEALNRQSIFQLSLKHHAVGHLLTHL